MRLVTEQAILADGRVLEQIGTTQFGMAAPAQFVYGIALEQGITRGVMRVVTGGAGHDALTDGMRIGLEVVGPLLHVAFVAHIRFVGEHRDGINRCMDIVAIGTGDLAALVATAGPLLTGIPGMALQAHGILLFDRCDGVTAEIDNRRMTRTHVLSPRMGAPWTMAAFALEIGEGRFRIGALSVRRAEDVLHALPVVAAQTGICSLVTVIGSSCRRFVRRLVRP